MLLFLCLLVSDPEFKEYPVQKQTRVGGILGDIESRNVGAYAHTYINNNDKVNWAHEATHGVNSQLRMHFRTNYKINAFYVLEGRAVVIREPNITLRLIYHHTPNSLRSSLAHQYLVQAGNSWNNEPLYCLDEWVAYTNGSAVRKELQLWGRAGSVKHMFEFNYFAIALCKAVKAYNPEYDDKQLKAFVMWNLKRACELHDSEADEVISKFKTAPDAEPLRQFARDYFGSSWCKEVLGI